MALGLGVLRLQPQVFWSMTLRELAAAAGAVFPAPATPPARADLDALLRRFPDSDPMPRSEP